MLVDSEGVEGETGPYLKLPPAEGEEVVMFAAKWTAPDLLKLIALLEAAALVVPEEDPEVPAALARLARERLDG